MTPLTEGLQCGHGPKAVENSQRRPECCECLLLQCGHGPKAVENAPGSNLPTNCAQRLQWGHSPKAVENLVHRNQRRCTGMPLQWGHSPKAVENHRTVDTS